MEKLPKVLRVGLVLDGRIVAERLIRSGADVSVGTEPDCSFVLPDELPGLPRDQTVFKARRGGYELLIDGRMQGKVACKGRVKPLAELAEGPRWRLDESARGRLILGPKLALLFQFVPAPPEPLRKGGQDFRPRYIEPEDPVFYGFLGMFSALAAVAMVWVYSQPPSQGMDIEQVDEVIARIWIEPAELDVQPIEDAPPSDFEDPALESEAPSEVADAGSPEPSPTPGPSDNPATQAAMQQHLEDNALYHAMMVTLGENSRGTATSLWGDDEAATRTLEDVLQDVDGRQVAVHDGPLIRGPRVPGEDIHVGELDELVIERVEVTRPEVDIAPQDPMDLDPELDRTQVTQVTDLVRRQAPQLQRCYELALNDAPSLGGRVEIAWTIMDGRSEMVEVYRNTTGSAELADCMVDRVERWTYPEGLETDLIYPFVLTRKN